MKCGWGCGADSRRVGCERIASCGAEITRCRMRAHFAICPKRPAGSGDVDKRARSPKAKRSRQPGPRMRASAVGLELWNPERPGHDHLVVARNRFRPGSALPPSCVNHPVVILTLMQSDQGVINAWRDSAPFWEKHREMIRQMFAPVTQALVADALIGRGYAVLDIATGPGEPALEVAAFVGPEGRVVGIDLVPEMVAAARRASERAALRNTQFDVALVDRLPFAVDTFDVSSAASV
jgi:hypothetical protein